MASPGTLVHGVAELLGMSSVYVGAFDRELAKHGLRAKHGRGASAASMTPTDAANLLIAILSGAQAKDAAEAVQRYAGLSGKRQSSYERDGSHMRTFFDYRSRLQSGPLGLVWVDELSLGHTFFDFVYGMIESAWVGELERAVGERKGIKIDGLPGEPGTWGLSISVSGPAPTAEITLECDGSGTGCVYTGPATDPSMGDLRREMRISHETIIGIGRILRG